MKDLSKTIKLIISIVLALFLILLITYYLAK